MSLEGHERADQVVRDTVSYYTHAWALTYRDLFTTVDSALHTVWQEKWRELRATDKMRDNCKCNTSLLVCPRPQPSVPGYFNLSKDGSLI